MRRFLATLTITLTLCAGVAGVLMWERSSDAANITDAQIGIRDYLGGDGTMEEPPARALRRLVNSEITLEQPTAAVSGYVDLEEATANGVNTLRLTPVTALGANRTWTFPDSTDTAVGQTRTLTGGAGIAALGDLSANRTVATASGEGQFLVDGGVVSLTCGAGNDGRMQVMDSGILEWCDGAAVSVLRTSAGFGASVDDTEMTAEDFGDWTCDGLEDGCLVDANAVALTTDTTGNYVGSVTTAATTGLTGGAAGSEGAAITLAFDYTQAAATDPALAASNCVFGTTGIVCEGLTANLLEGTMTFADVTVDRTWTFPDRTGTVALSGDTFTGDVTGTLAAGGATALTVAADAVALTTDTTGVYVASANTSALTGLAGGSAGSEAAALSLAFDYSATLVADPALGASDCVFADTGLICEGLTANLSEALITFADVTGDRTYTMPDRSGTVALSGDTFTTDVTGTLDTSGATALTVAANAVALTTDTTGNYCTSITTAAITGLTGGLTAAEGTVHTLEFDRTSTIGGNPAIVASGCIFGTTGLICEGSVADVNEALLTWADPAGDVTLTMPAETGTVLSTGTTAVGDLSGTYASPQIAGSAVGQAEIANAVLNGQDMAVIADDNLQGGVEVTHKFVLPAGVTGNVDFVITDKTEFFAFTFVKTAAAGGGAGTWQVATSGDVAITSTVSVDVPDTTILTGPSTLDDATNTIAAGGTLRFKRTRTASTSEACIVYVRGIKRT